MREHLRDFARFLAALWREWKVLLTGGTIIACISLAQLNNVKVPPSLGPIIAIGTFLLATYLAWRRQSLAQSHLSNASEITADQKVFVNKSPKALVDLYKDNTAVIADRIASAYRGKWLRVSGRVSQVSEGPRLFSRDQGLQILLHQDRIMYQMDFRSAWNDRLSVLNKGDLVVVCGQTGRIGQSGIALEDCELLSPDNTPEEDAPSRE